MDPAIVFELERKIEDAIHRTLNRYKQLPVDPTPRLMHLMAKSAVAVLEAVAESDQRNA